MTTELPNMPAPLPALHYRIVEGGNVSFRLTCWKIGAFEMVPCAEWGEFLKLCLTLGQIRSVQNLTV